RQDLAANRNGVYNIQTFVNGTQNLDIDFSKFSFDETIGLNRFIDYEQYKTKSERVQKLYNDNNGLSIFKSDINSGFLTIPDSTNSVYKIRVSDYKRNDAWITIPIKGVKPKNTLKKSKTVTPYYIYANSATNLKEGKISVDISPNTFY